jgi:hypothetical protein
MRLEHSRAKELFKDFHTYPEGLSVLREEVRELEALVFQKDADPRAIQKEAIQVGAMAMRFLTDLDGHPNPRGRSPRRIEEAA